MVLIDKASAVHFLSSSLPEWAWLIAKIESDDGRIRFPLVVSRAIQNLKIESYPLLYEKEESIGLVTFHAFFSPDEVSELDMKLASQTPEERGVSLREIIDDFAELDQAFEIPKTPEAEKQAHEEFLKLSTEDQVAASKVAQRLWMGFLAGFFQNVSVMVHGQKLTSLVAQAKAGDDEAYCKAVQIDKRILTTIPYFKTRFELATLEGERNFTDALAYRLQCPPYKGKIRHKPLWLAFAFLDSMGLLDTLKHQELLELLDSAGLNGYANRIEDVKYLSKRLTDFRRFRGYGLAMSTP